MYQKQIASLIILISISLKVYSGQPPAPLVVVDIAPLHSLVSQVMDGVGKPILLIPAESSPHEYSLLPSQMKALSNATLVFWMSEGLTPWLKKALTNVAITATKTEMINLKSTIKLSYREGATFEPHLDDHGDNDHHEDNDHHDEDHQKENHHAHNHHGVDPHVWLDPVNAKVWIKAIHQHLIKHDPDNSESYKLNAEKATHALDELILKTKQSIDELDALNFIVFHDAYQYFEKRFDISAAGAIALGDAEDPSPARIKAIRDKVKALDIRCVFVEPQYNPGLVNNIFDTSGIKVGMMDPLGANINEGKHHYPHLINAMVKSLTQCKHAINL